MREVRETLALAAKAIGHELHFNEVGVAQLWKDGKYLCFWEPHESDGDCARMEAALGIDIHWENVHVEVFHEDVGYATECYLDHGGDRAAARRYASTRMAAAVQKTRG